MSDEDLRLEAVKLAITYCGDDIPKLHSVADGIVAYVKGHRAVAIRSGQIQWSQEMRDAIAEMRGDGMAYRPILAAFRERFGITLTIGALKRQIVSLGLGGKAGTTKGVVAMTERRRQLAEAAD